MPVIKLTPGQLKKLRGHWAEYVRGFESDYIEDDSGFQMEITGEMDDGDKPTAKEIRRVKSDHKFVLWFQGLIGE